MNFIEIQSWPEIPSIAHLISLFSSTFDLPDFDIEVRNFDHLIYGNLLLVICCFCNFSSLISKVCLKQYLICIFFFILFLSFFYVVLIHWMFPVVVVFMILK